LIDGVESWSLSGLKKWRNKVTSGQNCVPEQISFNYTATKMNRNILVRSKEKEIRRQIRMLQNTEKIKI